MSKRKANVPTADVERKRVKLNSGAAQKVTPTVQKSKEDKETSGQAPGPSAAEDSASTSQPAVPNNHSRPRIRKLAPPRPFPSVAPSAPATAPRSLHKEGKNNICITRRTKLAAYLRRCKALIIEDGFRELRLSAMGAAIPHLVLLIGSIPQIVADDLNVEVKTGSVDVVDQILEESGDEDGDNNDEEFKTRVKSTMNVVIRVGGQGESKAISNSMKGSVTKSGKASSNRDVKALEKREQIILQEPEQEDMDML